MSLAQLGLILLLSLGLETTPQYAINTYPDANKILDMPDPEVMEVFQMSGPPSSPPISPYNEFFPLYAPLETPPPIPIESTRGRNCCYKHKCLKRAYCETSWRRYLSKCCRYLYNGCRDCAGGGGPFSAILPLSGPLDYPAPVIPVTPAPDGLLPMRGTMKPRGPGGAGGGFCSWCG